MYTLTCTHTYTHMYIYKIIAQSRDSRDRSIFEDLDSRC